MLVEPDGMYTWPIGGPYSGAQYANAAESLS